MEPLTACDKPDTAVRLWSSSDLSDLREGLRLQGVLRRRPGRRRLCASSTSRAHAADLPRKKIDKLGDFVKTYKAKGLAWTRMHDG